MSYRLLIKRSAEKELDALPTSVRERMVKRLLALEENPRPPGVRKLQGEDAYRLRVGDYRVLYTMTTRAAQSRFMLSVIGARFTANSAP